MRTFLGVAAIVLIGSSVDSIARLIPGWVAGILTVTLFISGPIIAVRAMFRWIDRNIDVKR